MKTRGQGRSEIRAVSWRIGVVVSLVLAFAALVPAAPASASSVASASLTGGAGTVTVAGTLYAKNGGALTLSVTTSNDTKCVTVTGGLSAQQTSNTAKTNWTFGFTAGAGDGLQNVSVT